MLVLGASGGVGTGCVILAKMLGAEVIACAGSGKARAPEGADAGHMLDYKTDFSGWAVEKYNKPQRRTYEGGVDVVINFTGGDTWAPSLRCLKRGGSLLVCGATAGHDPPEDLRYIWSFEPARSSARTASARRRPGRVDGHDRERPHQAGHRQGAAAGAGGRRLRLIQDREVMGKVIVTPWSQRLCNKTRSIHGKPSCRQRWPC